MDLGLRSRKVLVAGASRGLGRAIVSELLNEGADVCAVGRDRTALETAHAQWLADYPQAEISLMQLDLSDTASIPTLNEALARRSRLNGVIVVAGNGRPTGLPRVAALGAALECNVYPALVTLEATSSALVCEPHASVVIVSSIAGIEYLDCPEEYAAAKSTLHALCAHWSRRLAPTRVNIVAPGNMLTEDSVWWRRQREDPLKLEEYLGQEVTLRRLALPEEVARVAVFLVSDAASFMTGSTVVVDGGQSRSW